MLLNAVAGVKMRHKLVFCSLRSSWQISEQTLIWIFWSFNPKGLTWRYPPNHCQPPISAIDPSPLHYSPFGHYSKWKWTIQLAALALTFFLSVQPLYLAPGSNVYAFTEIAGGIVREKGGFIFFSFLFLFFPCAISCLQKPLMPIQHQHQGTALMSILATDLFLSLLPAALSLCLSPSLYPPLSLPLPFAHSLRLLYNQIIKRIVDKMILPGN